MMDVRKMASLGQKAMRKSQTKAQKVFWPMQAGRPREMKLGLLDAVNAGRVIANKLYAGMRDAKLNVRDARCVLVCATKNGKVELAGRFIEDDSDASALEILQNIFTNKWEPIGVAFGVVDRESGELLLHARPFERTERNERLLASVLDEWEFDFKKGAALKYD